MSLEEELAIEILNRGSDRTDAISLVEACENLGLKIERKKINIELKRNLLIRQYNSQDNSEWAVKRRKENMFQQEVDALKNKIKGEDSSIVEVGLEAYDFLGFCDNCGTDNIREFDIIYTRLLKKDNICIQSQFKRIRSFGYCFNCGTSKYPLFS